MEFKYNLVYHDFNVRKQGAENGIVFVPKINRNKSRKKLNLEREEGKHRISIDQLFYAVK